MSAVSEAVGAPTVAATAAAAAVDVNPYLTLFRSAMADAPSDMWRLFDPTLDAAHQRELFRWNVMQQDTHRKRYAYAVPTSGALDVIELYCGAGSGQSVVEIGAGTGYWAALLRARGCTVYAYDQRPPKPDDAQSPHTATATAAPSTAAPSALASSAASGARSTGDLKLPASAVATVSASVSVPPLLGVGKPADVPLPSAAAGAAPVAAAGRDDGDDEDEHYAGNRYHPDTTCFTDVVLGGPEKIRDHSNATLLLCWPPDFVEMGVECLNAYTGEHVIVIGEFLGRSLHGGFGLTGNAAFQFKLATDFHEILRLPLPNWPGCLDHLSVWKRTIKSTFLDRVWSFIPPSEVMTHTCSSAAGVDLIERARKRTTVSAAATAASPASPATPKAGQKRKRDDGAAPTP